MKLAVVLVLVAAVVAGAVAAPVILFEPSLAESRDIVIIVAGIAGLVVALASLVTLLVIALGIHHLSRALRRLLDDPIRPALTEMRDTARNVRGATEFVSDTAVHPLIRAVATMRGIRRGLAVLTGLRRR
ncbi:MAG: hypothetical protein OXC94_12065 [Chloroflexi bacterium]|nr:hypothetical protein [Chloroflexota bacterium]